MDTGTDNSGAVPSTTEVESAVKGLTTDPMKRIEGVTQRCRRRRTKKEIAEAEAEAV